MESDYLAELGKTAMRRAYRRSKAGLALSCTLPLRAGVAGFLLLVLVMQPPLWFFMARAGTTTLEDALLALITPMCIWLLIQVGAMRRRLNAVVEIVKYNEEIAHLDP